MWIAANGTLGDETAFEVTETGRFEEPIGDELRRVDNSGSSAGSTRRLIIAKRWLQRYEVLVERANRVANEAGIGLDEVQLRSFTENAVRQQYSITKEVEHLHSEEIEFTVPAGKVVEMRVAWKRLWQEGYVTISRAPAAPVDIPFRVVVGLTFDQQNRDL